MNSTARALLHLKKGEKLKNEKNVGKAYGNLEIFYLFVKMKEDTSSAFLHLYVLNVFFN